MLARRVYDAALGLAEVAAIWEDLAELGIVIHPFDPGRDGAPIAAITARLRRRHATDAAYVHLAQRLRADVWTLDRALARNAADVGLPVELVA